MKTQTAAHTKDCIFNGHGHCICKPAHTPTPWILKDDTDGQFEVVDLKGERVFDDGSACGEYSQSCMREDAAFIVRATNNFESLLTAAKEMRAEIARSHKGIVAMAWDKAINEAEK